MEHHDLLSGFIRLHILHHAVEGELYGKWMIDELGRHGYSLSPGTLYPMLRRLETRGYLVSRLERDGQTVRKFYRATPAGAKALSIARNKAKELFGEIVPRRPSKRARRSR
ncbi:PadR family transcriptional regulator [Bradyrhizobium sp.]|uniref:PadR family transcriptional regulator n=1 Tax=Bradyrhizobium sp. TaxID=376 RepID=UPI003C39380A